MRRLAILGGLGFLATALILPGCGKDAKPVVTGPPPSGPALPVGPLGHQGRWITDAEGRVVLVHGVNVVNKDPPYTPSDAGFSDADAAWLADQGFRAVRVGMLATGLMPTPGVIDEGYVQHIVATVEDLAQHQIFSLVDLHQDGWGPSVGSDGFPSWMTLTGDAGNVVSPFPLYYEQNPALQQAFQSFWDDAVGPDGAGLQDDYAAMFGAIATQLRGEPYVLGYDLLNEPWPGTTWNACFSDPHGCPSLDTGELGPAYARAAAAIRAAGDQHLVFGEPFNLFNLGVSATSVPVPGGDASGGMAFHVYPVSNDQAGTVIARALDWTAGTQGALLTGEWGATTDVGALTEQSAALNEALLPWIFWSFNAELVPSLAAAPGGANEVPSTASVLVQPYPLAVAGIPTALSINPDAGAMTFTWSTERAGGGAFTSGTVTTFEVPTAAFPTGYAATVDGGWITSSRCAPLLTIAAMPTAASVTASVVPAEGCD